MHKSDGLAMRTPLYGFVSTFTHFNAATKYISDKVSIHAAKKAAQLLARAQAKANAQSNNENKSTADELDSKVDYPKSKHEHNFDGYVSTICNNALIKFANKAKPEDAEKLMQMSIDREVKHFCSNIVYEAIIRIGNSLRDIIGNGKVKTISDTMVRNTIRQMHVMTGVSYDAFNTHTTQAMAKFNEIRVSRRAERKAERNTTNDKVNKSQLKQEKTVDNDDPEYDE